VRRGRQCNLLPSDDADRTALPSNLLEHLFFFHHTFVNDPGLGIIHTYAKAIDEFRRQAIAKLDSLRNSQRMRLSDRSPRASVGDNVFRLREDVVQPATGIQPKDLVIGKAPLNLTGAEDECADTASFSILGRHHRQFALYSDR
jgi:hypothetical protein